MGHRFNGLPDGFAARMKLVFQKTAWHGLRIPAWAGNFPVLLPIAIGFHNAAAMVLLPLVSPAWALPSVLVPLAAGLNSVGGFALIPPSVFLHWRWHMVCSGYAKKQYVLFAKLPFLLN